MKHILLIPILLLSACVSVTETRPDGTVVKTQGIDLNAFTVGTNAVTTIVDRTSGK